MPTLPEIRIPMPEDEQPLTLYGRITNTNEPPKYDDIQNSNLPKEEKIRQIQYRTKAYQDDLDRQLHKDYARMGAGTTLSAASFHPFFNIPYVGTGIGGAMYDLGQGIVEGDTAGDLAKRAGRGFVIGETIGAVPYAGKALGKTKAGQAVINSAPVQAVGNVLNKAGEKFANSKLYDALMTDVRAFNPNKQTAYHGSPYDFEKFSNEAIGTGEGAQAHGYGHYAAKSKDVGENYATRLSNEKPVKIKYKGDEYEVGFNPKMYDWEIKGGVENLTPEERHLFELIDSNRSLENIKEKEQKNIDRLIRMKGRRNRFRDAQKSKDIINTINSGNIELLPGDRQLYKLSVPKDDVLLREGLPINQQPIMANIFNNEQNKTINGISKNYHNFLNTNEALGIDTNKVYGTKYLSEAYEKFLANPENYKELYYPSTISGGDFYTDLANSLGGSKNASAELSKYGIKGISYNGGIDGEARVIFNPDDIVIGRKYYNQPNLYEQLTGKQNTGALVDALLNR